MRLLVFSMLAATMLYGSNPSRPVSVCLDDRVRIGRWALHAFNQELSDLLAGSTIRLASTACVESAIRISIRSHAPAKYQKALGLAFISGDRVLPVLELYTTNILRTLDKQASPERFGRALARVAWHEIRHYVNQQQDHERQGLFTASLNGAQLISAAGSSDPSHAQPD
jgi:hypothetical protein